MRTHEMSDFQHLFPVNVDILWQYEMPTSLHDDLISWLLDPSSLTERLKASCELFYLKVLGQQVISCPAIEACEAIAEGEPVLVREVLLYCDHQPHVFARTLLPLTTLTGEQAELATLGEQPIGQVIFSNSTYERKTIQISPFKQSSSVRRLCKSLELEIEHQLWGRRSLFYLEGKPLVISEIFLPSAKIYQKGILT